MKKINVKKLHFKPYCNAKKIEIMGFDVIEFTSVNLLFIIETDDIINDKTDICFEYDNILYELPNIALYDVINDKSLIYIESKNWKEICI